MNRRFKVVRVDSKGSRVPAVEEIEELGKVNADIIVADCDTEDEIINAVKDADAVITTAARLTRRVMENTPKCRVIVRYGIGYDTLDVDAATENGIVIVNIPDYCFEEVSNHAITLILACAKKLVLLDGCVKRGEWKRGVESLAPMGSIYGQTLGLIGCGNIGRRTARKAQCFDLNTIGYDPYADESLAEDYGISLIGLPELLERSDYISIHTPLNSETRHLIGVEEFQQMKNNACIINTARGGIIDEIALIKALEEKRIAGAGLDVFENEPLDPESPLILMENVVTLPHSAYYSEIADKRLRTSVGQEAARILAGYWPKNVVNSNVIPKVGLV
ncbi:MAG: C-terminal binding protein [Dehalococcoidales bacterium]|nr:MAG: C-terminal binding protein [Dehalococcoidales bacterium]